MQYSGTVKIIGKKETIGENALEKQTLILEENTDREFKGSLAVDFFKDKTQLLENIKVGDTVTVHLNARCNESKTQPGRYFNSITGWRIEQGSQEQAQTSSKKSGGDDLPF